MADSLSAVIRDRSLFAGVWGESDCLHWALTAARAAGGRDLTNLIPRTYRTRMGALRTLTRMGFRTLADALDAHAQPIPSSRARPGDVCMIGDGRIGACGIVVGADALFFDGKGGLSRFPVRGLRVWRL